MANFIGRVIGAAVIGGLLGGAMLAGAGCGKSDGAMAPSDKRPPALVNVAPAIAWDAPVYLDEIGKTSARETVTVMPQVAGRMAGIHFKDGADLKKDKLLFTIDDRPFKAVLQQAEAQLAKDQAASANADAYFNRQAKVYTQKFIAESDYDTAKFNAEGAKAAVAADKAAVASAQLNVEYCSIYSPIEGRAGMRLVDPGNIVKINETPLLVIQRLDPIYADFMINDRDLADVRAHMADHTLKALAKLPADGETDQGREGDLTFLDNAVQDASGTIKLRATVPNWDRHFWPGQYVTVRLVLMVTKNAVLVPLSAPQLGQNGSFVYVIKPDSTADLRPVILGQKQVVETGDRKESFVVVKSGVAAGERVVINGQLTLFPGAPVKVETPATAPSSGGHE